MHGLFLTPEALEVVPQSRAILRSYSALNYIEFAVENNYDSRESPRIYDRDNIRFFSVLDVVLFIQQEINKQLTELLMPHYKFINHLRNPYKLCQT